MGIPCLTLRENTGRLETISFGTNEPELRMNLQKTYDLDKARGEIGAEIRAIHPWEPSQAAI